MVGFHQALAHILPTNVDRAPFVPYKMPQTHQSSNHMLRAYGEIRRALSTTKCNSGCKLSNS